MRILKVSRYKKEYANHMLPFVTEQGEAIRALGNDVDYFLVRGNYVKAVGALKAKIRDLSYFKAKNYSIIPCGVPMDQCVVMDKAEARKQLKWDAKKKYILFGGAFDNLRKN